jgi:hypothetical protein
MEHTLGSQFSRVDIARLHDEVARDIRQEHVQWIDALNRRYGKSLEWWFGSISSRDIYVNNLFQYCCYLEILERLWVEDKKVVGVIHELSLQNLTVHLQFSEKQMQTIKDLDKTIFPLYQKEKDHQEIIQLINSCKIITNDLNLFNQQIIASIKNEMRNTQKEILDIKKGREVLRKYKPKMEINCSMSYQV